MAAKLKMEAQSSGRRSQPPAAHPPFSTVVTSTLAIAICTATVTDVESDYFALTNETDDNLKYFLPQLLHTR